jgi:hypothetical protein
MFDRRQLESFLRINGLTPLARNEEIRSMLLSARWNEKDVDTAIMILKENTTTKAVAIDSAHKIFHSDDRLTPSEIQSLLGIDVPYSDDTSNQMTYLEERLQVERRSTRLAMFLAIIIAIVSVLYVMYQEKAGFFHQPELLDESVLVPMTTRN